MSTIKVIPELDGLRGLAILIVLVYHFVNIPVQLDGWVANAPFLVWCSNLTWYFLFIGACLIVSIIMAVLSWNLFEKWFMKIKAKYEKKQIEQLITNTDKLVANSF